jgi:hypothetical protein
MPRTHPVLGGGDNSFDKGERNSYKGSPEWAGSAGVGA